MIQIPITYEEFMESKYWRNNVQYLNTMLQNGDIELATVLKILKEVND